MRVFGDTSSNSIYGEVTENQKSKGLCTVQLKFLQNVCSTSLAYQKDIHTTDIAHNKSASLQIEPTK